MTINGIPKAVVPVRVSTRKQAISGDQEVQLKKCKAYAEPQGWEIEVFYITESGRKEDREEFEKVIDYCIDPKNGVDYLLVFNISRFTRLGSEDYFRIKRKLEKAGVKLRDSDGKIQDTKNVFADLGLEYEFTLESPSEKQETAEANEAKAESKKALQNMMRFEIEYVRLGYWTRRALYGFQNVKIDTERGERTIMVEKEPQASIMRTIFTMRAQGYDDKEIVDKVNSMGFRTAKRKKRDRVNAKKVIGYLGDKLLTPKRMQAMILNTAYAGVISEKWTLYKPVKANFVGLVDTETYNLALRGKKVIKETNGKLEILKNQKPQVRLKNNPLYPFKSLKCHICGSPLMASASKSKSGKYIPRYHCARKHKYWSENKKEFEKTIYNFIHELRFARDYFPLFKEIVLDVWQQKQQSAVQDSLTYGQRVNDLRAEKQLILDRVKSIDSKVLLDELAKDMERVNRELEQAEGNRNTKESHEHDIDLLLTYTQYFVEHLEELLIDRDNPAKQTALFELLFEQMPTYQKIVSGTPELALVFDLNEDSAKEKSRYVDLTGFEPVTSSMPWRRDSRYATGPDKSHYISLIKE